MSSSTLVVLIIMCAISPSVMAGLRMEEMEDMLQQMHGKDYAKRAQDRKEEARKDMTPEEKRAQEKKDAEHHQRVQETVRRFQADQKAGLNPDVGNLLGSLTGGLMGSSAGEEDDVKEAPRKKVKQNKGKRKIDLNEDPTEDYTDLDEL